MNRGKMKKVLALMLTFIFVISATACGGATKFDAEAYVRGVMDANYKQKYDEYAKARGISEKDAKAEIEDNIRRAGRYRAERTGSSGRFYRGRKAGIQGYACKD